MIQRVNAFPKSENSALAVRSVIDEAISEGLLGTDVEFSPISGPTILGVASRNRMAATWWTQELGALVVNAGVPLVAYAGIGADKPEFEESLGVTTPLSFWRDAMISHWLLHPDLASVPKSTFSSEGEDTHVMGQLNIWAATSLIHDLPRWKGCISRLQGHGATAEVLDPDAGAICVAMGRICAKHTPLDYCLRGTSRVHLSNGKTLKIRDIVNKKLPVDVFCVNKTGELTVGKVNGWHRVPRNARKMLRLSFKGALNAKGTILTEDHKVLTRRGWIAAGEILSSDQVNTGLVDLSAKQKKFLTGILLGDTYNRNGALEMGHTEPQFEYLKLKETLFKRFYKNDYEHRTDIGVKQRLVRLETLPAIKVIPRLDDSDWVSWVKKNFSIEALATWYMDDGSLGRYAMYISACSYSDAEREQLADVIESLIGYRPIPSPEGLRFTADGSRVLSSLISPYVPSCLRYKLYKSAENFDFDPTLWADDSNGTECFWSTPIITLAKKPTDDIVYCIDVVEHHNFRTGGGIVHNCAADAWAGLIDHIALEEQRKIVRIPDSFYFDCHTDAHICHQMQWSPERGLDVDIPVAQAIDEAIKTKKSALFPCRYEWDSLAREKKEKGWGIVGHEISTGNPGMLAGFFKKKTEAIACAIDCGLLKKNVVKIERIITVPGKRLAKPRIIWDGPFNPSSPQQVLQWFSEHGILLRDRGGKPSMAKPILLDAIERRLKPFGLKMSSENGAVMSFMSEDETQELPYEIDLLVKLGQKTLLGKGIKSWIDVDKGLLYNGRLRGRFNSTGTSTGRLSHSKPNLGNWASRGWALEMRKIIKARDGYLLIKADSGQLEFRAMLYHAGLNPWVADGDGTKDAFVQLVEDSKGDFERAAERNNMKPRDVAKSGVHGNSYLEGIKCLSEMELSNSRNLADRGAGALIVYDGRDGMPLWKFRGRIVCFTGSNLAERLFGDRTRESRRKANGLQKFILDRFSAIRELQMRVTHEIEHSYEVRLPNGHRVELYGKEPEDDIKYALAVYGQGTGAFYIRECMRKFAAQGKIADLQVHDELVFTSHLPIGTSDAELLHWMTPMVQESDVFPGFASPAEIKVSMEPGTVYKDSQGNEHTVLTRNWKETRALGKIRSRGGVVDCYEGELKGWKA